MSVKTESTNQQQIRVNVRCMDGSSAMGYINIGSGENLADFMNDPRNAFVTLNEAEIYYEAREVASFKLVRRVAVSRKPKLIMQKASVAWLEEI